MSAKGINIEPITAETEALVAIIHASAFPPNDAWSPMVISLHLGLPGGFGLVDRRGGFVLARTMADEAEILTLAVEPTARFHGLGRDLMHAAMRQAAEAGARTMFLEVSEHNGAARRLYARLGFTEVGRRKRYYANGDDALVLRFVLTGPDAAATP